jgi:hypothetical protein
MEIYLLEIENKTWRNSIQKSQEKFVGSGKRVRFSSWCPLASGHRLISEGKNFN